MQLPDSNSALKNLSALVDFSNYLNSNLNLEFTLNNLLLTCLGKLQTTKGVILLFDEKDTLQIKIFKGIKEENIVAFPNKNNSKPKDKDLDEFKLQNGFALSEKIESGDHIIGYLFLGKKLTKKEFTADDKNFLSTIVKIGGTAIANALNFEKLKSINKTLDSKINQLNTLFDLGKEFSSILEIERVSKLLTYSITAQMLVSKYAVVIFNNNEIEILNSKIKETELKEIIEEFNLSSLSEAICIDENSEYSKIASINIELIVPMMIKNKTKGLILLGKRMTNQKYSQTDIEYISSVGSLAIISIENSRLFKEMLEKQKIEKDLELARTIQQNLLPKEIPSSEKFEIVAYNKTARQVGGDFYDVAKLENGNTIIAIADVSGKGIQASLLVANLQAFLKSLYKLNYPLQEASNLLNDLISENTTNGSFITAFWGIIDEEKCELTYINMGHNPPLLIRDGKIIKLKKGGMILGVMQTIVPYEYETIPLKKDDTIILFTDGITEAMNISENEYSNERLEELGLKISNNNASEILDRIIQDVNEYTKGAEQSDDITCMVIKVY